jgi:hypothetical protein
MLATRNPHAVILWLNDYRIRRLRWSVVALADDMTRAGFPIKGRTLMHVFAHAARRADGLANGEPRDVTVAVILGYVQYLRDNAKRRAARARKRQSSARPVRDVAADKESSHVSR